VIVLCVAVSLSLGVGSYGSVSAERSVSVSVVPPEEAYLAFGDDLQCGRGGGNGDNDEFVRNQFGGNTTIERVEVEVTAVEGAVRVGTGGPATQLSSGASARLTFDGPYEPGESASIQIKPPRGNVSSADTLAVELVEATGSGVRVAETSLTYEVSCPGGDGGGGSDGRNG
jgi:hypothetical protein